MLQGPRNDSQEWGSIFLKDAAVSYTSNDGRGHMGHVQHSLQFRVYIEVYMGSV